ncbi:tRNA uridine-5-carboxymethylaminomethyl(34) synthesis GTPase MnmE [Pontibacter sp. G13]|uniref:tRNA uridine-5-carboxymethylaminomethyl(34) synthesis GTPase MnmE n=1 Tax=Pontibacter sp. G13 TaxID=3074898 RepID=UPI002889F6E4|nr:tRNA uridine-5-carboxymethylaminomethyl(34) synthesis GTPase MnmE [Pontibacter sp. G13]WNJ17580.1 tRNA uridine-5-carboxymethylaminomethyl(34) synthesis GTPase MnmE [Pontibacter sp. G13]
MNLLQDTIAAICTPAGSGALGIIRVSGPDAISLVNGVFSRDISQTPGHRLVYGNLVNGNQILDEVVLSVFRGPKSFTREDTIEISCHGSPYILREALMLLTRQGARLAEAGEFTQRSYLNGAMDLAQAEAVADLIASTSEGAHKLAMSQLRGGVSDELKDLREQLLNFTSLIELELDFSEEDVEFADRSQLEALIQRIGIRLDSLIGSFSFGNAVKEGVPTVIMGRPNAGKSTLLNTLLNENRAIVSDIAGTTRDVIEDRVVLEGIEFRLMDTAGVRETGDVIEAEGVKRTLNLAKRASLLLYIFDLQTESVAEARDYLQTVEVPENAQILLVGNKLDLGNPTPESAEDLILISAKAHAHIDELRHQMVESVRAFSHLQPEQAIISNVRHLDALHKARTALQDVQNGMAMGISGDLLAIDIRTVLHYIGEITGEITTDEVLGNIFSKFCIGK